jgi:hypothetical protein
LNLIYLVKKSICNEDIENNDNEINLRCNRENTDEEENNGNNSAKNSR